MADNGLKEELGRELLTFISRTTSVLLGTFLAGFLLLVVVHEYARWRVLQGIAIVQQGIDHAAKGIRQNMKEVEDEMKAHLSKSDKR